MLPLLAGLHPKIENGVIVVICFVDPRIISVRTAAVPTGFDSS